MAWLSHKNKQLSWQLKQLKVLFCVGLIRVWKQWKWIIIYLCVHRNQKQPQQRQSSGDLTWLSALFFILYTQGWVKNKAHSLTGAAKEPTGWPQNRLTPHWDKNTNYDGTWRKKLFHTCTPNGASQGPSQLQMYTLQLWESWHIMSIDNRMQNDSSSCFSCRITVWSQFSWLIEALWMSYTPIPPLPRMRLNCFLQSGSMKQTDHANKFTICNKNVKLRAAQRVKLVAQQPEGTRHAICRVNMGPDRD